MAVGCIRNCATPRCTIPCKGGWDWHRFPRPSSASTSSQRPAVRSSILDLGAGTGNIARYLRDCKYTAIEPNAAYVEQFNSASVDADHRALVGYSELAEDLGESFDIVVIFAVLHHIDDAAAERILATAARVLASGGRLVTLDTCIHKKQNPVAYVAAKLDRGRMVRRPGEYGALISRHFKNVTVSLREDLIRLPYSHLFIEASDPVVDARQHLG